MNKDQRAALAIAGVAAVVVACSALNSKKARILSLLRSLPSRKENRVLYAQFMDTGWKYSSIQAGFDSFGKWPAVVGGDYWEAGNTGGRDGLIEWHLVNASLIQHWNKGGLITLHAYFGAPGFPRHWGSQGIRSVDFDALMDRSSTVYADFRDMMSMIADGLQELKDAGVVVLFRWLSEMNGSWSWWGGRSKEIYQWLWEEGYDYFVRERKLSNLIWIYGPNARSPTSSLPAPILYYPGDALCDVVGLDWYSDDPAGCRADDYEALVATGKPFCFAEIGPTGGGTLPSPNHFDNRLYASAFREKFPRTMLFQSWSGPWALRSQLYARELLDDPWVVTLEELRW